MRKQANTLSPTRLRQALDACGSHRDRAMVLLSVKAGLRAVEIAGLKWKQADMADGLLRLRTTKGDKPRNIPIHPELASELRMLDEQAIRVAEHDHIFTNRHSNKGAPLTGYSVAAWFRDLYTRKLGWEGFSSHSGRRTFCTNVARKIITAGGSVRDIQALMGHEDLQTTQGYIETSDDAQRKVIDLI